MLAAAKGAPQAQPAPIITIGPLPPAPPWPPPGMPWFPGVPSPTLVPWTPVNPDGTVGPIIVGPTIVYGSGFVEAGIVAVGSPNPYITGFAAWSGTIDGAPSLATFLEAGGRIPVDNSPGWAPSPMLVLPRLGTVGLGPSMPPSDQRYGAS